MLDLLECFDDDDDDGVVATGTAASSGSSTAGNAALPLTDPVAGLGDDTTLDEDVDEVDDAVDNFRRSL